MNYTITAVNKETRDQHWHITLCPFCRKHFILESVYDCTPFFPSNYNPNDPEFTGEYEGPAYDFNSDDIPF